jgi:predicted DNA-binding transcriptional regulator AlpA
VSDTARHLALPLPQTDAAGVDAALPPLLLTARQAAVLCAVSPATWWRWVSAGRSPAPVRVGGCVRWPLDGPGGLRAWIAAGCPDRRTWEAMRAAQ